MLMVSQSPPTIGLTMPPHKHAPKPVTDTSVQSAGKVLQTRPFQPDVNTNQQAPQLQKEPEALTGGFDLTKIQYDFSPPPISPLGQPLQAKLTIGEPNDKYEQEADRVAHDVVQRSFDPIGGDNPNSSDGKNDVPFGQLLRDLNRNTRVPSMQASVQPMSGGWDLTKKVFVDEPPRTPTYGLPLQPKLTIGAPNDKYEQEADRVAKQVVQRLSSGGGSLQQNPTLQRETLPDEEDELQMKPLLQREVEPDDEDELQMKPLLQRQGGGAVAASDELESAIQQSRGSGQPLSNSIREPMEQAFGGVDFSGVKVHTDGQSDQLNQSIQAKAFTTGQDIYFRQGVYQPNSQGGAGVAGP